MRTARRNLIVLLIGVLLALLLGEGLLGWLDPLGFAYYRDQSDLGALLIPDPRGYNFQAGTHKLREFTFTLLPDGTRAVPDTNLAAPKTLVFMGDSVTFGYGVNDQQTWVDLVAKALPDVHVIDAGVSGYNSANVLRTLAQYPQADALVYLIINNDAEPENQPDFAHVHAAYQPSWIALYLLNLPEYLSPVSADQEIAQSDVPRYLSDLRQILADQRVLALGFDDAFTQMTIKAGYPVSVIERGTDRVSPADGHPGVRGNQAIARQVLPMIRQHFGM
ncbi:MAG TPA: hypothetical protein VHD90_14575 [Phototrophicaceae bacterium]|nr:hypothetical protein [Phototrophicaceae bacterium]